MSGSLYGMIEFFEFLFENVGIHTIVYLTFLVLMSIITLILYVVDKIKSKQNKWRIQEKTLLCFGFFGGSIGALIGMKVFRHKTLHTSFWVVNIIGILYQLGLLMFFFIERI